MKFALLATTASAISVPEWVSHELHELQHVISDKWNGHVDNAVNGIHQATPRADEASMQLALYLSILDGQLMQTLPGEETVEVAYEDKVTRSKLVYNGCTFTMYNDTGLSYRPDDLLTVDGRSKGNGKDQPDWYSMNTKDVQECLATCQDMEECTGFMMRDDGDCNLINKGGYSEYSYTYPLTEMRLSEGYRSYFKECYGGSQHPTDAEWTHLNGEPVQLLPTAEIVKDSTGSKDLVKATVV